MVFEPFLAILVIFLKMHSSYLCCQSFLWSRVMGKPILRPIGFKIAILSYKYPFLGSFGYYLETRRSQNEPHGKAYFS